MCIRDSYAIDSIRNLHEAKALLELEDFTLVYITAPAQMRFERMKNREREGDPKTIDAFLTIDRLEMEGRDDRSQRLADVISLACKKIVNDAGFEVLYERVDRLLEELSAAFKQKTAYEIRLSLVGSEMCIRDRCTRA